MRRFMMWLITNSLYFESARVTHAWVLNAQLCICVTVVFEIIKGLRSTLTSYELNCVNTDDA